MRAESVPKITIRLDHMAQEMIAHLGAEGSELGEVIQARIKEEAEKIFLEEDQTIRELVRTAIRAAICERVETFFKYGNSGHLYLYDKIDQALEDLLPKKDEEEKDIN
jgi:hypothetical protein